ncbi:hypothetical protein AB0269_05085 [Microbacterium sp. NPDC077644]|uniref:hypothetical protein n=1 Tax=Microbacterium sp. NPDC077644 TaxID=3155055 RepID=UPI00344CFEFC
MGVVAAGGLRFDDAMTEMDADADRTGLVPGAHRLIRALRGSEGPFEGALVGHEDGVAVSVDVAELAGWDGWARSGADHVCGVLDVRRTRDGHEALLPWCTQRVEAFLGKRQAAGEKLSPGEIATLVASLLRGIRELGSDAEGICGDWWLTGEGRPLFVQGEGGAARAQTAALLDRVGEHTADRPTIRVIDEMAGALRERRHHADDEIRWEQELFAQAAPRALRLDVFAPERALDVGARRDAGPATGGRSAVRVRHRPTRAHPSPYRRLVETARAAALGVVERLSLLFTRFPRPGWRTRGRAPAPARRSHRRPLMLAVSLAAVVLIAGLMWPQGEDTGAAEAAQHSADVGGTAPEPSAGPAPDTAEPEGEPETDEPETDDSEAPKPVDDPEDALSAVPAILDALETCAAAEVETCPSALGDGVAAPTDGLAAQGADASTATLVDDYGDVAVVRLTATAAGSSAAEQMLVLERRDEKWLVRDVYDVAHQPE